jgi:ATP phosphoribosyltransferase
MSLSIALTKGRLEEKTVAMLEKSGYGVEKLKDKGRALIFPDTKKDIQYFLAKPNDVITYVEHGVADIGIVGKDTLMEGRQRLLRTAGYEYRDLPVHSSRTARKQSFGKSRTYQDRDQVSQCNCLVLPCQRNGTGDHQDRWIG